VTGYESETKHGALPLGEAEQPVECRDDKSSKHRFTGKTGKVPGC